MHFRMSDLTQNDDIGPAVTVTCQRGDTLVETYFFFFFVQYSTKVHVSTCAIYLMLPLQKKRSKMANCPTYLTLVSSYVCNTKSLALFKASITSAHRVTTQHEAETGEGGQRSASFLIPRFGYLEVSGCGTTEPESLGRRKIYYYR